MKRSVYLRRWYRRRRRALIARMGGKCFRCGYKWRLEFHHLRRRNWVAKDLNRWCRLAAYEREYFDGIICLACRSCNAKIGRPQDKNEPWIDEISEAA